MVGGVHIIEKTSPVSFHLKNQLDGSITKAYAENIRLANIFGKYLKIEKVG